MSHIDLSKIVCLKVKESQNKNNICLKQPGNQRFFNLLNLIKLNTKVYSVVSNKNRERRLGRCLSLLTHRS